MKGNILIVLVLAATLMYSCANTQNSEGTSSNGQVTSVVSNKFKDKAAEGVGYYAVGENDEWIIEIDFNKYFVFNHPGAGISVNKPISEIGIDQRGDQGQVFTVHSDYGVIEVNNIYQSCGDDSRSYHVRILLNPEDPKPTIYKGCAYNLK